MDDDGGPSYWWRDKRIQILHKYLSAQSVEARVQQSLYSAISSYDPDVIERLERYLAGTKLADIRDSTSILEGFSRLEESRRRTRRGFIFLARALFTVGISTSLWIVNKAPYRWWHYSVWTLSFISVLISIFAFRIEVGEYFGKLEFEKFYRQNSKDSTSEGS